MSEIARAFSPSTAAWESDAHVRRLRCRRAADRRLQIYGIGAIVLALGLLATLFVSLIASGASAFVQTHIRLDLDIASEHVSPDEPAKGDFRAIVRDAMLRAVPEATGRAEQRELLQILSSGAQFSVRDEVVANPDSIGREVSILLPAADPVDQLHKGAIKRITPQDRRRVSDRQIAWYDKLLVEGLISAPFNWALFVAADSRFPELAGLAGALIGSAYALFVCFVLSFPIGIAAAIYLEEFAPKNRWTDIVEVNINNLAAVPSIVFGLLGLAVFLNFFGLPRSAPLVGGMVLALMALPTTIIAARAALKAVPPSIRQAALGVGASRHQATMNHVLPLAMPGILTGTIIAMAQALGETSPLLLIGMNAFITAPPEGILDAATALPTQIFIWADSPERGFVSRTSAGILVLLAFLVTMNAIAIFLRKRFERRW